MNFSDIININIPEGVVSKITTLEGVVLWEKGDSDIVIPDYPETPNLPIPNNNEIYYTSTDGKIITLNTTYYKGIKPISNTYINGIGKMVFENDLTEIGVSMFESCNTLSEIILPKSVITIDHSAFCFCRSLIGIYIPNSVKTIGKLTFGYCTNLTSVIIPSLIINMNNQMFYSCSSLNKIKSLNIIAPTLGNNIFYGLPEVGTLYINEGATGYDVWLENLPEGWSIQYIVPDTPDIPDIPDVPDTPDVPDIPDIPDLPTPNYNEIYYITTDGKIINPAYPSDIKSNTYTNGIGKITYYYNITEILESTFENERNLLAIKLPTSVTRLHVRSFYWCKSLININLTDNIIAINNFAFCRANLNYIKLPSNLKQIGKGAFSNCTSLQTVIFNEVLEYIQPYAFTNCTSLNDIQLYNVKAIEKNAFSNCTHLSTITSLKLEAPILREKPFENVGTAVSGLKVLRVPQGATGYDVWLEQLEGFTIEYITE